MTGLGIVLSVLTRGAWGTVPAGATGVVVAGIAALRRETPAPAGVRIVLGEERVLQLSARWTVYLLVGLLGVAEFPFGVVAVVVGWVVGNMWVEEVVGGWRVPGWVVGEGRREKEGRLESLRRRLEVEGGAGVTEGMRREI